MVNKRLNRGERKAGLPIPARGPREKSQVEKFPKRQVKVQDKKGHKTGRKKNKRSPWGQA